MAVLAASEPLRTHELAAVLGVSTDTVRRGIASGAIPAIRLGSRGHWLIPTEAVIGLLKSTSSAAPDHHANAAEPGLDAALGAEHLQPTSSARANPENPSLRAGPLAGSARALDAENEEAA